MDVKQYIEIRLDNQIDWYDKKSMKSSWAKSFTLESIKKAVDNA